MHPTFLYESLWNVGVLLFLFWFRKRKKFNGDKSIDHEVEGSHIQIGADLCKKYKESQIVINTVESQNRNQNADCGNFKNNTDRHEFLLSDFPAKFFLK